MYYAVLLVLVTGGNLLKGVELGKGASAGESGYLCIFPANLVLWNAGTVPFLAVGIQAAVREEAVLCSLDDVEPGRRFRVFEPLGIISIYASSLENSNIPDCEYDKSTHPGKSSPVCDSLAGTDPVQSCTRLFSKHHDHKWQFGR